MREMLAAAERLRAVRRASRQFLALWAVDCLHNRPSLLDRVAEDVSRIGTRKTLATADEHDWSFLYRGSILDD